MYYDNFIKKDGGGFTTVHAEGYYLEAVSDLDDVPESAGVQVALVLADGSMHIRLPGGEWTTV